MEFIEQQKIVHPDIAAKYDELGELCEKKLWHQLSIGLERFMSDPSNQRGDNLTNLYTGFISTFESRLNQVHLANLISLAAKSIDEPAKAIQFLEKTLAARARLGVEAALCLDMDCVMLKVRSDDLGAAKELLLGAKDQLASIHSTDSVAFSKYYQALSEYKKITGEPQEFYNAALMLLAYTPLQSLSEKKKFELATDMVLASITADAIYNFGEVLATPILGALQGTSNQWMRDLVKALHAGDSDMFDALLSSNRQQYDSHPAFQGKHDVVRQKLVLLSLMNMVFERPSHDREISFADIVSRTKIPLEQVEWVLMKAMSLGLVKGTIDEVEQAVDVTWVQPRVLDMGQLQLLRTQLDSWTDKVKNALVVIEDQTPELYV